MGTWRRIKRDLALAAAGFQEATIAIAERVHHRVQHVKNSMLMSDLEHQIRDHQAVLGEKSYRKFESGLTDLDLLSKEPDLAGLSHEIDLLQNELALIEEQATEEEPLRLFEQVLADSGLVLQHAVIPNEFPWIGKAIAEWSLPAEMRIVYIRKKNGVEIANGRTVVEAHDQITYIGPRRKIHIYKLFWFNG